MSRCSQPDVYVTLDDGNGEFFTTGFIEDTNSGFPHEFITGFPTSTSKPTNTHSGYMITILAFVHHLITWED